MRQIRITGIVSLAQRVRRQWAVEGDPAARELIVEHVRHELQQIDAVLAQHRGRPEHLPAPSRRAYALLRQLADGTTMTTPPDRLRPQRSEPPQYPRPANGPLPESVSFTGLRAFHESLLDNIAAAVSEDRGDWGRMLEVVQNTRERLDRSLQTQAITAEQLKPAARELLAWFRWFSEPQSFSMYVEAVERAQRVLGSVAAGRLRWNTPLLVHFQPTSRIYQWRIARNGTRIVLTTALAALDDGGLRALGGWMRNDRAAGQVVMELLAGEECQELFSSLQATVGEVQPVQGMAHDLAASFQRVNQQFFDGQIAQPRLIWSPSLTGRRFGHYQFVDDTVCISSSLDRADVPAYVVDHVMHHELLHKKHGARWKGQRRHVHTPEFRLEERQFPHYAQADAFLRKLARE